MDSIQRNWGKVKSAHGFVYQLAEPPPSKVHVQHHRVYYQKFPTWVQWVHAYQKINSAYLNEKLIGRD